LIVDTDHWRHFWVLLGLIWGMVAWQHDWNVAPLIKQPPQAQTSDPKT